MRIQADQELIRLLAKRDNPTATSMLNSLKQDPRPGWAEVVDKRPNRYWFRWDAIWIVEYEIDDSALETIIKASAQRG